MISLILLIIAGALNGALDHIDFHTAGPDWEKKYKLPLQPVDFAQLSFFGKIYYHLSGLHFIEKFPLSGTLLVFLTDRRHLVQFLYLTALTFAILFYNPISPRIIVDFFAISASIHIPKQIVFTILDRTQA